MRRPSPRDIKRSIVVTLKGLAAMGIILAIIAFSPLWEWSGYQRPSSAAAVANIIVVLAIMTPIFLILELLEGGSDSGQR